MDESSDKLPPCEVILTIDSLAMLQPENIIAAARRKPQTTAAVLEAIVHEVTEEEEEAKQIHANFSGRVLSEKHLDVPRKTPKPIKSKPRHPPSNLCMKMMGQLERYPFEDKGVK